MRPPVCVFSSYAKTPASTDILDGEWGSGHLRCAGRWRMIGARAEARAKSTDTTREPSAHSKQIRHWSLTRMLYWPSRSPTCVSNRCPARRLGPDHDEDHLELRDRLDGMGLASGKPEQVPGGHAVWRARDGDLGLALDHQHERVERSGVLAQSLPGIEREGRDVARLLLEERATDHSTRLVLDERGQGDDALELGGGVSIGGHGALPLQARSLMRRQACRPKANPASASAARPQ